MTDGEHLRDVIALVDAYRARELSPVDVVADLAPRLEAGRDRLNAIRADCLERARAEAKEAELAYAQGAPRPLEGVPFVAKDLFDTAGVPTDYGSRLFDGHVPERDAAAVARLRAAGAILVAKTATDEFAHGIAGTNTHWGAVRNPWALDYVSGGSSAGSGAAVGAGIVPLALGSDTGGSIRVPAAFCGVVGFKPTFGAVSRDGLFPMAPSLDHAGVIAGTPRDAALAFDLVRDARPHAAATDGPGLRVGVSDDLIIAPLAPAVARSAHDALTALVGRDGSLVEVAIPGAERVVSMFPVIQRAEAHASHRRLGVFPARADEYYPRVRERLELGSQVTLDEYLEAQLEREALRRVFLRAFDKVDVLVTPVAAVPPGRVEPEAELKLRDHVLAFTTPHDLFGLPSCTVRAGFDDSGLPLAVQIAGPPGADAAVLSAAVRLYDATPEVQSRRPPEWGGA